MVFIKKRILVVFIFLHFFKQIAFMPVCSKIFIAVNLFLRFRGTRSQPVHGDCEEDDQVLGNGRLLPRS